MSDVIRTSNGNNDLGRDRWPNVTDGDWLRNLAHETFADHHSQRDTGNRLRQIASRCDADGYRDAFYVIAELLGLSAMPISPKEAFETVMLPRLRQLTGNETRACDPESMRKLLVEARSYIQSFTSLTKHPTAPKDASNLVARIQAALRPQAPKIECDHRRGTDDSGEFCSVCGERVPPSKKASEPLSCLENLVAHNDAAVELAHASLIRINELEAAQQPGEKQ